MIRQATESDDDIKAFVSALIFHWLTLSTDAHAKNYSLLLSQDTARLAPLYDLNSYLYFGEGVSRELSMRVGNEYSADKIRWSDWSSLARDAAVDENWVAEEIRRQAGVLPDAFSDAARRLTGSPLVTSDLPQRLAGHVDRWARAALAQTKLGPLPTAAHPG